MRRFQHATALLLAAIFALLPLRSSHAEPAKTYKVRAGDTLGKVAKKTDCSVDELRRANRIKNDIIHPGKSLKIPKSCRDVEVNVPKDRYKVRSGDTLSKIAKKHGCAADDVKRANRLKSDNIHPGDSLKLPTNCQTPSQSYKVKSGDTLGKIAKKHGCSTAEIKQANRLKSDNIQPGARLTIPLCSLKSGGKRRSWKGTNHKRLPKMMKARGFHAPADFKAMIVEISFNKKRTRVKRERVLDYNSTSDDRLGWNPASTVKLFAAIAAVQRIRALGFSPKAKVTFHSPKRAYEYTVRQLIEETLTHSNNITYNRLVQLASFDLLNGKFLTAKNGLPDSAVVKAYAQKRWAKTGESASLRYAPRITIKERKKKHEIAASKGTHRVKCASSACTTPRDLAEGMRRLMLQEQLPKKETFGLKKSDLVLIRKAMRTPPKKPNEVLRKFSSKFKDKRVVFFSKAGFSRGWFTNNFYIFDPRHKQAWIVVMTSSAGRQSLQQASAIIAEIIASGELRRL